jgi:DNA-nicking Smr family endonuclease
LVTGEEVRLWRQAMRDTRPLPGRALEPPPPDGEPSGPPLLPPAGEIHRRPPAPPPPTAPAPELRHDAQPGLDRRTARRMRRGELVVEAAIDLHGLTQEVAHAALSRFIGGSAEMGRRVVLVITGKGTRSGSGELRAQVPHWLNHPALRAHIVAFTYAQPKHGGEGALYVLLKRRR